MNRLNYQRPYETTPNKQKNTIIPDKKTSSYRTSGDCVSNRRADPVTISYILQKETLVEILGDGYRIPAFAGMTLVV